MNSFTMQLSRHWIRSVVMVALVGMATPSLAQDFSIIERRLGELVAKGELTLEQAHVMLHALHEHTEVRAHQQALYEHLEHAGIDRRSLDRSRRLVEGMGMRGLQAHRAMEVIWEINLMKRRSSGDFELPESLRHRLSDEFQFTPEQLQQLFHVAQQLHRGESGESPAASEQTRRETEEAIVHWIEGVEEKLSGAVENGELEEQVAWEKWEWIKETKVAPKLEAAVEKGHLSEEQAEHIWVEIEEREAKYREE